MGEIESRRKVMGYECGSEGETNRADGEEGDGGYECE